MNKIPLEIGKTYTTEYDEEITIANKKFNTVFYTLKNQSALALHYIDKYYKGVADVYRGNEMTFRNIKEKQL